jgi:hypothetical protein
MQFTTRLREGVRDGSITCSVRIWQHPHVKPGGRYRMGEGEIEVDSIQALELADITPKLARESGFAGVVDLLKTAKHGPGTNVYLVRFHYLAPGGALAIKKAARSRAPQPTVRRNQARALRARARVARILARLPGATASATGLHLSLEVGKKRFGYFLDDHHGDGRLAINCKSTPELRDSLPDLSPAAFHVPKYLGNKGWIGLWLDVADVRWPIVELALREAYALVAPKTSKQVAKARRPRS